MILFKCTLHHTYTRNIRMRTLFVDQYYDYYYFLFLFSTVILYNMSKRGRKKARRRHNVNNSICLYCQYTKNIAFPISTHMRQLCTTQYLVKQYRIVSILSFQNKQIYARQKEPRHVKYIHYRNKYSKSLILNSDNPVEMN